MKPTVEPGRCFLVNENIETGNLESGELLMVRRSGTDQVSLVRVAAIGGQTAQLVDGQLQVDGVRVDTEAIGDYWNSIKSGVSQSTIWMCATHDNVENGCAVKRFQETNGKSTYEVLSALESGPYDNTEVFVVPEGSLFVLGDNRDFSNDSRIPQSEGGLGFVPISNVIGRLESFLD